MIVSSDVVWNELLFTEVGGEDLAALIFDDTSTESIEKSEFNESSDGHPHQTPPSSFIIEDAEPNVINAGAQEAESVDSDVSIDSDNSETSPDEEIPSTGLRRAAADSVNYRTLQDPWSKTSKREFAIRANKGPDRIRMPKFY